MITIVNYGLGNVSAFVNMYKRMNIPVIIATKESDLIGATHIILPGVGAFDQAMSLLNASGMCDKLQQLVVKNKIPVLGVCVGMQMLANSSDEGERDGLGWIPGHVRAFSSNEASATLPLPHMGWNDVKAMPNVALFKGLYNDVQFYFLHSYYFDCSDIKDTIACADYGFDFTCSVRHNNVYGVQFHPEKSHHWGARLLKNFAEL